MPGVSVTLAYQQVFQQVVFIQGKTNSTLVTMLPNLNDKTRSRQQADPRMPPPHAQMDRQPINIMPPAPSIKWARLKSHF